MVSAHGSGESFELESEGYLMDIGYSVEEFTDDSSVILSFELKNKEGSAVEFTDVWVRIIEDTSTVFATGVHNADLGGALMTYKFPSSGDYKLSARFQNNGESLVEGVFPLTVVKGSSESGGANSLFYSTLGLLGGLVLGAFLVTFIRRLKN